MLNEAESPVLGATRGDALRMEADRHEAVARAIDSFLKAYPDDAMADRYTMARLRALYWTATARGHELDPIEDELGRIDLEKARPAVREAASYWRARLARDRLVREWVALGEQPPVVGPGARMEEFPGAPQRLEDEYARRHATTPSGAAICRRRAIQALAKRNLEQAAQWIDLLEKNLPNDAMLDSLKGELRLLGGLGEVWAPALKSVDGKSVDWNSLRGRVTLVVFWSPRFRPSVTLLRRAQAVVSAHPEDVAIVTIGIDDDPTSAAAVVGELGLTGPNVHDGLGWRSPVARQYGVRVLPIALFLDRDGRLAAIEQLGRRQLSAEVVAQLERMIDPSPTSLPVETQPTERDDGIALPD